MIDNETGEAIDARAKVVIIARTQVGIQDPDKYWTAVQPEFIGHPHDVSWCGGFALWCLHQAGLCDWKWEIWKGPGTNSGFLFRLKQTFNPLPGDIAYFARNQHHAIVEKAPTEDGLIALVNGNAMPAPLEGVVANVRKINDVAAFYSIASLIS